MLTSKPKHHVYSYFLLYLEIRCITTAMVCYWRWTFISSCGEVILLTIMRFRGGWLLLRRQEYITADIYKPILLSGHSGRGRDCRKGREDDRKRKDDDRRARRSRSRSRSRDRRRSRSRSRERRYRLESGSLFIYLASFSPSLCYF